ncbi:hypothetical protein ACIBO1_26820 [Micromonospora sp. NPDC049903]|uniref:hypothetical protein n=1 Tax=Micromonospora sp. NPDC049903 TaxID=3364276 RepID=UPI003792CEAF
MTVGTWRDEAHRAVRAAATAVTGQRADTAAEIIALLSARNDLYRQLARATELVVGGRPAEEVATRAAADLILSRHGQSLTRFYVGLLGAATMEQYPPAPPITTGPARSLRRAADAVGVMGDIIASHIPLGQRPKTPEGAAIRAGGGVQGTLSGLARITTEATLMDARLPSWLSRNELAGKTYAPAADAARWVATSRLGVVARDMVTATTGRPGLDELDIARVPLDPAPAVDTIDAAIVALRAARTWLWQNPDQVAGVHLRVGTQLGLAAHILTAEGTPSSVGGWRQAAIAAADLRATPPSGTARDAAGELGEVLRWTRSLLDSPAAPPRTDLARLAGELPLLAAALHQGLTSVVRRHDLFLRGENTLRRPTGSLVYRATVSWRPAIAEDDLVRDISQALSQIRRASAASAAATAFPRPTRPGPLVADSSRTVGSARPPGRASDQSR